MGEKPRLPPVSTLLKMTDMDDFSSSHRNDRRSHRSSNHFDGGHLSASFTHHRGRSPASPMEIDHPSSSSSRSRRQDAPSRGSASGSKSTIHSHRGGHLLPSVSEVLGSARDSRGNEWPPSTMHERGSASGSRSMQVPPPVVEVPSHGHGGHPCERCGRMFTRKSDAIKHKRVVHDKVKTFTCRECGRKFARKDYCTKHEKSLHNITPPPTQYQIRRQLARQQAENRRDGRPILQTPRFMRQVAGSKAAFHKF